VDDVDIQPDFIADLKYLATEKGGRLEYATSGYRPHIRFPFSQSMTTGEQVFWEKDKVYPGEKIRAQIRILNHVTFRYALSIGTTFEFCEGSRIIGTGKIVEVVDEALKKASR
jgi:translation elongation factor EF-Tu-like GTPase